MLRILAIAALALGACRASSTESVPPPALPGDAHLTVTLLPDRERQTIHGFGASDAWSTQFVGEHWPVEKRERIADLLFSMELHQDGSPRGIGLPIWRFNIGAGSADQGSASGISDEWRRAGSFLRPDGTFDPDGQPGQRWFLRAANARGVEHFVGFVNSPPVHLTRNGRAFSSGGASSNLRPDRYPEFARFLTDVVVHLDRNDGVKLAYVSPFNEPQWDWEDGQEGSPWLNEELGVAVAAISAAFHAAELTAEIEITEAGKLNYLYEEADRPGRGDQISTFFSPDSPLFVGELPNVAYKIAGHSYYTTYGPDTLLGVRRRLREHLDRVDPGLEFWMTEYCVLENNPRIRGRGRDLGMHTAIYVAEVLHADLTVADASSWQWWLGVSPYDYKDGLVYIDRDTLDGEIYESKLLWTLGHFSRFVRPGMKRIEVAMPEPTATHPLAGAVLASAFKDPGTGALVAVLVNRGDQELHVRLDGVPDRAARAYLTTEEAGVNLRFQGSIQPADGARLPARSLTTVLLD
jgi:O-glycosyl hydrolase